jgi:hypothetical protein
VSPLLRRLRTILLADFEDELILACRFWVLTAAGYKRHEIAKMLEASRRRCGPLRRE